MIPLLAVELLPFSSPQASYMNLFRAYSLCATVDRMGATENIAGALREAILRREDCCFHIVRVTPTLLVQGV